MNWKYSYGRSVWLSTSKFAVDESCITAFALPAPASSRASDELSRPIINRGIDDVDPFALFARPTIGSWDCMFDTVDWSLREASVFDFYESCLPVCAGGKAAWLRLADVSCFIDGFFSCALGKVLTASFKGFYRLFSDFDISMLLMDDSMASSTIIEFVSVWSRSLWWLYIALLFCFAALLLVWIRC